MTKVLINIGGRKYVLDRDKAVQILELMSGYEVFESRWHKGSDDTYHVFKPDASEILHNGVNISSLPVDLYEIAKLAGKPE
jgi:hypothetical protein|tara:strand:+ start:635 stop:877 length:243 start_codon:yes stop_codon:yes gene_type:complete